MHHNDILARLHDAHPDFVTRRARQVSYVHGDIVGEAGAPIDDILFPSSGMISLVVDLADGDRIEAGMVGRRGMVGGSALFGGRTHLNTAFAQLPGSGWTVKAADLLELADRAPEVRDLFFRNEQYALAQAQQTAACNAKHRIPQRLATWILRAHYDSGEDELMLTQEYLAQMLGVQRASVSMFAGGLQDRGLIFYRRGRVRILDRTGLEREACECHAALRGRHTRLFEHEVSQGA
ncbi:MAG TPA: Crp/Fnr family transcriptional regulator [Pseudolabrys sp.]|jgi:CRP-like cAMP-binding protein|nr:Crp/Fnr family transcriptional regulator [Pseudolabrys sp.]